MPDRGSPVKSCRAEKKRWRFLSLKNNRKPGSANTVGGYSTKRQLRAFDEIAADEIASKEIGVLRDDAIPPLSSFLRFGSSS